MTPDGGRRRGWLRPAILGVGALSVASGFAQFGVTAVLGDVARSFGVPGEGIAAEVGMTGTQLGIGIAAVRLASLGSLPGAALADRLGRRRVILVAASAGLALTALAATSGTFWWFVLVAALARPLLSTTNAVAGVIAAEETRSFDRAKAVALVSAAYAVGSGAVAIIRGQFDLDFRAVLALALVPLALIPVLARRIDEPAVARDAPRRTSLPGAVPRSLHRRLVIVSVLAFGIALVTGPTFTYLFVYGENVLGSSPARMALLVVAAGPAGLGGLLAGRWSADRVGRRLTAGLAMALTAVFGAAAYSGTFAWLTGGYLATITASGAFTPAAGSLLAEIFPTSVRATASGWSQAAGVLGAVGGLAAFGALADLYGTFGAAAVTLAVPVGLSSLLYAALPETRGLELEQSAPEPE